MITALRGRVRQLSPNGLIVQVGPIDLQVFVPTSLAKSVEVGAELELFTHLVLRPDQISLYGLPSRTELELFELLVGVQGVGPKLALSVLSRLTRTTLPERSAVAEAKDWPGHRALVPGPPTAFVTKWEANTRSFAPT